MLSGGEGCSHGQGLGDAQAVIHGRCCHAFPEQVLQAGTKLNTEFKGHYFWGRQVDLAPAKTRLCLAGAKKGQVLVLGQKRQVLPKVKPGLWEMQTEQMMSI